jgi:hypothetical protein
VIWGAWLPLLGLYLGSYLKFTNHQQAWIFNAFAIASLTGMFFGGLLHCFFYVPSLSATNAIAFANLKDAQKDFGFVRLWGTIGWIAASWPLIFILIDWARFPRWPRRAGSSPGWARRCRR